MKLFSLFIFLPFLLGNPELGKYTYASPSYFSETIQLKENNRFNYQATIHMLGHINVEGSYYIVNDSLFLNSYPQRDRIIVDESRSDKRKDDYYYFNVRAKDNRVLFTYHLYLILADGKEVVFRDQYKSTKSNSRNIKGFYIIDTKGLKSPTYLIKGSAANVFNIQFECRRVFENESWVIKKDSIIPRGLNGEIQKYSLLRTQ